MWSLWKVLSNGWHNPKRSKKKQATRLRLNCRWAAEQEDPLVGHWVINPRENWWCLGPRYLPSLLVLEETLSRQKTHVRKHLDYNFYLIWPVLNGEKNTAFCPKQLLYLMITYLLINIVANHEFTNNILHNCSTQKKSLRIPSVKQYWPCIYFILLFSGMYFLNY